MEDPDGTFGLSGIPGLYVFDDPTSLAWIQDATCMTHPRGCSKYYDSVCLRNVRVTTSCRDNCYNHIRTISNVITSVSYKVCSVNFFNPECPCISFWSFLTDVFFTADEHKNPSVTKTMQNLKKHQFEAVLPKDIYEITFYDQDGNLDRSLTPFDIKIEFGDMHKCANHLVENGIDIKTAAPTLSPIEVPLIKPL